MQIIQTTGDDPRIRPLLEAHATFCAASGPAESCHYLPPEAMAMDQDLFVWVALENDTALGVGALRIDGPRAEIKSMHTSTAARGKGVARKILDAILTKARQSGITLVQLETGSMQAFAPARALYERAGFTPCPPFGRYTNDPNSAYYALTLHPAEPAS